ncbi:glutathione S-transferase [Hyphomonas neptunium ATCC 15444]|uniref:Glutathione S-transferase n=2 Tax=Hyphomonas TaxID=85 RepID=Q0C5X7_HYPNA|nr:MULTISPECIES: glutathione S-transferase [Hyphomonas]ABI78430.1 glutathione S-transferase [Hyphomonas neptunium ATCC 15444]KCZ89384.1 glutathione S-transferase [Hyphomonas hirschiana VP5]
MRKFISGNLNYSSWSIRPLLVVRKAGLGIEEEIIPLDFPETTAHLKEISPTAKVPLLIWDGTEIWESLAITEFVAELTEPGVIWPKDATRRAIARAVSSEMHAGFAALRQACSMDIRGRAPAPQMTQALEADISRIQKMWSDLRETHGQNTDEPGPFLFGAWSAADAFYTPVVTRFRTFGLPLTGAAADYAAAVLEDPLFTELEAQAAAEPWWISYGPEGRSSGYLKPEA